MFVVENIQATVAGGNATFNCTGMMDSQTRPVWWFKGISHQSEYEVIYNGQVDSQRYDQHFLVNNLTSITLMNASENFAGRYKCQKTPNGVSLNEFELVVLDKCEIFKLRSANVSLY